MTRQDGIKLRETRRARVRTIRARVLGGSVALFLAVWMLISVVLITGHDPALASRTTAISSAARTSTAAGASGTSAGTGSTSANDSTSSNNSTGASTSTSSGSSGGTSSATGAGGAVTTSQS